MNAQHNTPGSDPKGNPYRVPDGYFAELRSGLRERIAAETTESVEAEAIPMRGLWHRIRGIAGLSAAFGCLVLFATVGYYFTGYKAQQREQLTQHSQQADDLLGYRLYTEDIEQLDTYAGSGDTAEENILFAEAVTEYLDTYGYNPAEGEFSAIIDSNNQ